MAMSPGGENPHHRAMLTPELIDGLARALEYGGATHTLVDLIDALEAGDARIWVGPGAAIVTQLHDVPTGRVLHFWLAAGELAAVIELQQEAIEWGQTVGCTRATLSGRKGWAKALAGDGWRPELVLMSKEI